MNRPNGVICPPDGTFGNENFRCKDCGTTFTKKVLRLPVLSTIIKAPACPECKSRNTTRDTLIIH